MLNAFTKTMLRELVELSTSLQDVRLGKNDRYHELGSRVGKERQRIVALQGYQVTQEVAEKIEQHRGVIRELEEQRGALLREIEDMGPDCRLASVVADKLLADLDPDTFAPVLQLESSSFAPHSPPAVPTREEQRQTGLAQIAERSR